MYERAHRKIVYPTQKQDRDTHPERKSTDILSNEEALGKSDTRQSHTPGEECGCPE